MDCEAYKNRLSDYIDDQLPPAEKAAIEAHLDACPNCELKLAELKNVVAALGNLPQVPMPAGAQDRLEALLDARLEADIEIEKSLSFERSRDWREHLVRHSLSYTGAIAALLVLAVVVRGVQIPPAVHQGLQEAQSPLAGKPAGTRGIKSGKLQAGEARDETTAKKLLNEPAEQTGAPARYATVTYDRAALKELARAARADNGAEADTAGSETFRGVDAQAKKAAEKIAGRQTFALISLAQGRFEGENAWIIVVRSEGKSPAIIAGAAAIDDGRLLYRTR